MKALSPSPTLFLFAGLGLSLAACGTGAVSAEEYDDVATSMAPLVADQPAGEAESMSDASTAARGDLPPAMSFSRTGSLQGRRGSVDYSVELACFDAGGGPVLLCERADNAHLTLAWDGEIHTARRNATLHRTGDWTLTGIQSEAAELNGTGTFHVDGDFTALFVNETRSYLLDYQADYQAVTIGTADRKVKGGKVLYTIHAERTIEGRRNKERAFDLTGELTFNDDGTATLILDGTREYQIQLGDGAIALRHPQ